MFHIIHGENLLEQEETLAKLLADQDAEEAFSDLNRETLTAPLTLGALRQTADTLPFLGGQRTVLVHEALKTNDKRWLSALTAYLPTLPPSTLLVFLERSTLPKSHPVMKLAQQGAGMIHHAALPKIKALPAWIQKRAQKHHGAIDYPAAALLARNLGLNLHQLDQELQKLLIYRGDAGPITLEDVRTMVPYVQSADVIFELVDALGQRQPHVAARHLHRLLDADEHPLRIFGMIVRQYRLLIQVRWLAERGKEKQEIAQQLQLHPFVAQKTRAQARHFSHEQLRRAYGLLLESDLAIKTGKLTPECALDLLVAQLTRL